MSFRICNVHFSCTMLGFDRRGVQEKLHYSFSFGEGWDEAIKVQFFVPRR
jgi:hypothetical protein